MIWKLMVPVIFSKVFINLLIRYEFELYSNQWIINWLRKWGILKNTLLLRQLKQEYQNIDATEKGETTVYINTHRLKNTVFPDWIFKEGHSYSKLVHVFS